jgi:hypothetical protein
MGFRLMMMWVRSRVMRMWLLQFWCIALGREAGAFAGT